MNILIKETGTTSFCDNHITGYWYYKLNPKRISLKKHHLHRIEHYDKNLLNAKKYYAFVEFGLTRKELSTDSFRDAVKFLIKNLRK